MPVQSVPLDENAQPLEVSATEQLPVKIKKEKRPCSEAQLERMRKMREAKARKRAEKQGANTKPPSEENTQITTEGPKMGMVTREGILSLFPELQPHLQAKPVVRKRRAKKVAIVEPVSESDSESEVEHVIIPKRKRKTSKRRSASPVEYDESEQPSYYADSHGGYEQVPSYGSNRSFINNGWFS